MVVKTMTMAHKQRANDEPARDVNIVLTFEEARLASMLDAQIQLLESGEVHIEELPADNPATRDFAELLGIAALLRLRGQSRRALI